MIRIKDNLKEILALLSVLLVLIGLPIAIWWYELTYLPSRHPDGTRLVNLTAKVEQKKCLWTLEQVDGLNYWWKKFKFAEEIPANEGQTVIFRVKSADVMHSFAIPQFRIGPYEIEGGKVKEVKFEAQRQGNFKYLCWLWCSDCHGDLTGRIVVTPPENSQVK